MLKVLIYIFLSLVLSLNAVGLSPRTNILRSKPATEKDKEPLKVLALMVEFEKDDLYQTTGNGSFNSGYPLDSLKVDAPMHDADYFRTKLLFAKNYFEELSGSVTTFSEITVLSEPVKLNHPIWFYNRNDGESDSLNARIVSLHSEAWKLAEEKYQIKENYPDYNTFVIFHAGSGQEFSTEVDETPFDLPSAFYSTEEILKYGGDDSIANTSIILPECQWQSEGYNVPTKKWDQWYFPSMNGIVTLMFAHRLGLPNLYDSGRGDLGELYKSGIGYFGLMDQGSGNYFGLLPSAPMAWSRIQLGWQTAVNIKEVANWDTIPLIKRKDIYQVDLNDKEYFLIENRVSNYGALKECFGYNEQDEKVIRLYYEEDEYGNIEAKQQILVEGDPKVVRFDDYDFGLPASGAFIWHIDKRKTTDHLIANNLVNEDWDDRGIFLEEADYAMDIGEDYWLLDNGYNMRFGWECDAFFAQTYKVIKDLAIRSGMTFSPTTGEVEFSAKSLPACDTKDGTKTFFRFYNFSSRQDTMTFSFANSYLSELDSDGDLEIYTSLSNVIKSKFIPEFRDQEALLVVNFDNNSTGIFSFESEKLKSVLSYPSSYQTAYDEDYLYLANSEELIKIKRTDFSSKTISGDYSFDTSAGPIVKRNGFLEHIQKISISLTNDVDKYTVSEGAHPEYLFQIKDKWLTLHHYTEDVNTYAIHYTKNLLEAEEESSEIFISKEDDSYTFNLYDHKNHKLYKYDDKLEGESTIDLNSVYDFNSLKLVALGNFDDDNLIDVVYWNSNTSEIVALNENGVLLNNFPVSYKDFNNFELNQVHGFLSDKPVFWTGATDHSFVKISDKEAYKPLKSKFQLLDGENYVESGFLSSLNKGIMIQNSTTGKLNILAKKTSFTKQLAINNLADSSAPKIIELGSKTVDSSGKLTKDGEVYCWPNPAKDKQYFRIGLNAPAEVSISIFDFTGKKIKTIKKTLENTSDILWDTQRVAPGAYLASVEVTEISGSSYFKSEKFIIKSAIVK